MTPIPFLPGRALAPKRCKASILAIACAACFLGACGQRGPLYLPQGGGTVPSAAQVQNGNSPGQLLPTPLLPTPPLTSDPVSEAPSASLPQAVPSGPDYSDTPPSGTDATPQPGLKLPAQNQQ